MTAAALRRRRAAELVLAAVYLAFCYPLGFMLAVLLVGPPSVLWLIGGPVLLAASWLMAAALLASEKRRRGSSTATVALSAAARGLVVIMAVPFGIIAVLTLVGHFS